VTGRPSAQAGVQKLRPPAAPPRGPLDPGCEIAHHLVSSMVDPTPLLALDATRGRNVNVIERHRDNTCFAPAFAGIAARRHQMDRNFMESVQAIVIKEKERIPRLVQR